MLRITRDGVLDRSEMRVWEILYDDGTLRLVAAHGYTNSGNSISFDRRTGEGNCGVLRFVPYLTLWTPGMRRMWEQGVYGAPDRPQLIWSSERGKALRAQFPDLGGPNCRHARVIEQQGRPCDFCGTSLD